MRELAVQSRNATNSDEDRNSLDKEFGELAKEIQRVLGGTTFNGKAILGGPNADRDVDIPGRVPTPPANGPLVTVTDDRTKNSTKEHRRRHQSREEARPTNIDHTAPAGHDRPR